MSCQRGARVDNAQKAADINWADSAKKLHDLVNDYYNDNKHDSLVMMVGVNMDLCREHQLWHQYFETWMKLGDEYVCTGQPDSALMEAQQMHTEAMSLNDDYGLAAADYIKALVYSTQRNPKECAHLLREVLDKLKGMDEPRFLNKVYTQYTGQLRQLDDHPTMELTLKEWRHTLDSLVRHHTDTVKITKRNLLSFLYMYQRSCYSYYYITKAYHEAALAIDSIAYYNELMGWTDVARNEVVDKRIMLARAQKHYEEAMKLSDEQLNGASKVSFTGYLNALELRHQLLANMGRWNEAYDVLLKWNKGTDSIRNQQTTDQLNELSKRFEVDEVKMQGEREKMQAERRQLYLVLTFILLVAVGVTLFIFQRYRSAKRMAKMKAEQERIEGELNIARDIQMSMVPSTFPEHEGLDIYASMTPAREVGGDLYGCIINGTKLYFAVGDVSGKGVPASLFMAQVTRLFSTMAHQGLEPAAICNRMNSELSGEDNVNGMFVTMFIGMLDMQTGHLAFCNAGHNPPVIGGGKHQGDFLKMIPNVPIGLWPNYEFQGEEMDSVKGRALFIYTDGLNEAENPEQEQFGDKRLLDILRDTQFDTARQVVEALEAEVAQHRNGAEPNDDLTMMCLRVQ
ncbi:MAG: PP2C family protein-serine/threonine phosphatase [Prevotella sp.]|nr:PP2C family protein-serine/threonine phosphatase [Prevotella sp.]